MQLLAVLIVAEEFLIKIAINVQIALLFGQKIIIAYMLIALEHAQIMGEYAALMLLFQIWLTLLIIVVEQENVGYVLLEAIIILEVV
jgi:hypothetical protein